MAANPQIAAFVAAVSDYVTQINVSVDGIQGDVDGLKKALEDIQNSPGTLSPEDQASLDAALTAVGAIATKVQALDDATPPAAPSQVG